MYVLIYTALDDDYNLTIDEYYQTWAEASKAAKELKRLGKGTNFVITDIEDTEEEIELMQNDYDCDSLVGTSYESESFFDC
jgi:hypothetical protein